MRVSLFWYGGLLLFCLGLTTVVHCGPTEPQEKPTEKSTEKDSGTSKEQTSKEKATEPITESKQEAITERTQDGGALEQKVQDQPPTKPSFDPVVCGAKSYKWLPTSEVGKVISTEKAAISSLSKPLLIGLLGQTKYKKLVQIKYGVKIYKYRYTTQDRGKKVEATGVLAYPDTQGKTLKTPYVLWLHGTSGFMDQCAPSRSKDGALSAALVASQGYIAVAPDYIGMNGFGAASTLPHAYLVGEAVALGSWDAVRAAKKIIADKTKDVTNDGRIVVWGGSQGGHATLFTTLYAPYYAPNLRIAASVAIIPPVDLLVQSEAAVAKLGKATITLAAGAAAMSRWYGFRNKLNEVLTDGKPYNLASALPDMMDKSCNVDAKNYKFTKTTDIFTNAFYNAVVKDKNWKGFEKWRCIMEENSLNRTSVKRKNDIPTLFIVSGKDDLVNPAIQKKSYDILCKQGYRMNYIECQGASHTKGAIWSLPSQFKWVEARLAGKPMQDVCKRPPAICCIGTDPKVCTP